jgi:hypothetical protein
MVTRSTNKFLVLDHSIRGPSPLTYHMGFMVGLARERSSSMVPELRSWVQFPLVIIIIITYLFVR